MASSRKSQRGAVLAASSAGQLQEHGTGPLRERKVKRVLVLEGVGFDTGVGYKTRNSIMETRCQRIPREF